MDAGSSSFSSTDSRCPIQDFHPRKKPRVNADRFIPNRSAMDFDFAHYMLMKGCKKEPTEPISASTAAYRKLLAETFNMNRRILAFGDKPQVKTMQNEFTFVQQAIPVKPPRCIPQTPERVLDAPGLVDDYYLNLLDWGTRNVLAIALGNRVMLWDASNRRVSQLGSIEDEEWPVTSVKWAPDGINIAVGLFNSEVQLWDSTSNKKLRTFEGIHRARVASLDWNNHVLTTGGMDGRIINNDIRIREHKIGTYMGHALGVCGLKWSASGWQLASGGIDNLLHIWDRSMASIKSPTQYLHKFTDHKATVKALAWCPFQSNLLASGGGSNDRCIKFWNTHTGRCLNSVDTRSQVCALLWNENERELLSSHGSTEYQLTLWKYPSMVKITELTAHTAKVNYMAQSPDGSTIASAAGDETVRIWKNVFGVAKKPATRYDFPPHVSLIR